MGVVLDTSVLVTGERRAQTGPELLRQLAELFGDPDVALSTVSVAEFTHGIYRAPNPAARQRREGFAREIYREIALMPVTFEIAHLAGRIEGEQAALGNTLAFEDLLIGATALYLGYGVVTTNLRHFRRMPGLQVLAF